MSDQQKISAGFVIMNPLTGHPMKQTPSGMSLENVTFSTKEPSRSGASLCVAPDKKSEEPRSRASASFWSTRKVDSPIGNPPLSKPRF
ncbi:MAG: hypothetical protein NTX45_09160 [Proteobacteria bacterium]|nr:hypothetical protein [Pseudomonadota bacterium]